MKTFWTVIAVIVALLCGTFVGCSIYANVHDYSNVIEWVKDWSVFDKDEKKDTVADKTEISTPEDSTETTAVIKF